MKALEDEKKKLEEDLAAAKEKYDRDINRLENLAKQKRDMEKEINDLKSR